MLLLRRGGAIPAGMGGLSDEALRHGGQQRGHPGRRILRRLVRHRRGGSEIDRLTAKIANLESQLAHAEAALIGAYDIATTVDPKDIKTHWAGWASRHGTALRQAGA